MPPYCPIGYYDCNSCNSFETSTNTCGFIGSSYYSRESGLFAIKVFFSCFFSICFIVFLSFILYNY